MPNSQWMRICERKSFIPSSRPGWWLMFSPKDTYPTVKYIIIHILSIFFTAIFHNDFNTSDERYCCSPAPMTFHILYDDSNMAYIVGIVHCALFMSPLLKGMAWQNIELHEYMDIANRLNGVYARHCGANN